VRSNRAILISQTLVQFDHRLIAPYFLYGGPHEHRTCSAMLWGRRLRRVALLVIGLLAFPLALTAQAPQGVGGNRFALVIGNGEYAGTASLKNPVNDATDMAAAMRRLGFTVELLTDAELPQMEQAVVRLGSRLSADQEGIGYFFYAGHGVQSAGINYLIPSNASIAAETFLRSKALSVQAVLDTLSASGNRLNIVVLDACRNNPFGWGRGGARGLTVVSEQPVGSIVTYATSAGSVAQDGEGRNGVFTAELLKHIETSGIDVAEVFRRTGAGVSQSTGGRQVPAVYNQYFDVTYLAGGAPGNPAGVSPSAASPAPGEPQIGRVQVATGNLSIGVVSAATITLLGKDVQVPDAATLPVQGVPAGTTTVTAVYPDGKIDEREVSVSRDITTTVRFEYRPSPVPGYIFRLSTGQLDEVAAYGLRILGVTEGTDGTRKYLTFSGNESGISGPFPKMPTGDPDLTFSLWVRSPHGLGPGPQALVDFGSSARLDGAGVTWEPTGQFAYANESNYDWWASNKKPKMDWFHVACTKQGLAISLYIDGKLVDKGSLPQVTKLVTKNIDIGRSSRGESFAGDLGEVVIFDRVLTPAEIAKLAAF
jgi:hypothetical protein